MNPIDYFIMVFVMAITKGLYGWIALVIFSSLLGVARARITNGNHFLGAIEGFVYGLCGSLIAVYALSVVICVCP